MTEQAPKKDISRPQDYEILAVLIGFAGGRFPKDEKDAAEVLEALRDVNLLGPLVNATQIEEKKSAIFTQRGKEALSVLKKEGFLIEEEKVYVVPEDKLRKIKDKVSAFNKSEQQFLQTVGGAAAIIWEKTGSIQSK